MIERDGRLTVHGRPGGAHLRAAVALPRRSGVVGHRRPGRAGAVVRRDVDQRARGRHDRHDRHRPAASGEEEDDRSRILVWDPPHVLEHEWRQAIVEDSVVRYELQPDGDGTLLRFSLRGLGARNATGFRAGTHAYLDRLEAYLAGDDLPDWAIRRQEIVRAHQESK